MAQSTTKKRHGINFKIADTFPPSDPIAIDLLRLQAAYNDLSLVFEWIDAHKKIPTNKFAKVFAASRWSLQFRLLAAYMHEALNVLKEMEELPDFTKLKMQMDPEGQSSLKRLRSVRKDKSSRINKFITITRHKTAFHYDRGLFAKSLKRLLGRYTATSESHILVKKGSYRMDPLHFELPDEIRTEISVGLTGAGGGRAELESLLDVVEAFFTFVDSILSAYIKDRGLAANFQQSE